MGDRIGKRLAQDNIKTAWDLACGNPKALRRKFSVVMERTIRELNGEPCLSLELLPPAKQEIVCTRSFSYKVTELVELKQAISQYAERACEKLRAQNCYTDSFWVYLESFDKKVGYYFKQKPVSLPHLSNDTRLIAKLAASALEPIFRPGLRYKKCGIGLLDVRPRNPEQADFITPGQSESADKLMSLLDNVNARYGKQTMKAASTGIKPKWIMKREYISPSYTTRWADLPRVLC